MNAKDQLDKIALISMSDIKYTVTGTERCIFEYALKLQKHADVEILIPKLATPPPQISPAFEKVKKRYEKLIKKEIDYISFPSLRFIFYMGLPKDAVIYLPYDVHSYIPNLFFKSKNQRYIIGAHGMSVANGMLPAMNNGKIVNSKKPTKKEWLANSLIKIIFKFKKSVRDSTYFHVSTDEQRLYLIEKLKIKSNHIYKIPPIYIDISDYNIRENNDKRLRVIHIGGSTKNSEVVAETIKKLIEERLIDQFVFEFIGKRMDDLTIALAKKYKNVINYGYIDDEKKCRLLSKSDVLISPALETFGVVTLQGLASGLNIVSRGNTAAKDLYKMGASIYVLDREQPDDYVEVLRKLLKLKKEGRFSLKERQKNKVFIQENFSYAKVMPKVLKMFESVDRA